VVRREDRGVEESFDLISRDSAVLELLDRAALGDGVGDISCSES
jgi:hypothetical protein